MLALAAVILCAPCASASGPTLIYDLAPWADASPELAAAWQARGGDTEAVQAAVAGLTGLIDAHASHDPAQRDELTLQSALWLRADLLRRSGDLPGFDADLGALQSAQSALANDLNRAAAEIATAAGEPRVAARHLLSITPGTAGHVAACRTAVDQLRAAGEQRRAAAAVGDLLAQPLSAWARSELTLLAAALHSESDDADAAAQLLLSLWWTASSARSRDKAAAALRALGRPLGTVEKLARIAIRASRRDARQALREVEQFRRVKGKVARRTLKWARAVVARHDPGARESAAATAGKLASRLTKTPAGPWATMGHALTLRKLDRDLEAVDVYRGLARRWPDHVLVPEALDQAAGLLESHGLPADAAELSRRVISLQRRGAPEREALWRIGFGAHLQDDWATARVHLMRLVSRYGADRDGLGVTWAERAGYWLARTQERDGRLEQAVRGYTELAVRFPLGWYALLSTQRRDDLLSRPHEPHVASAWGLAGPLLASSGELFGGVSEASDEPQLLSELRVVRRPQLDRSVALLKFGDEPAAVLDLEALHASGQLPGSGRALLAALYRRAGDDEAASSLLRRHQVLAEIPTPDDEETYAAAYPFEHAELIEEQAARHNLPAALLAGLVHIESRYNPRAVSGSGAIGLTQLMPTTARTVSRKLYGKKVTSRGLRDPETNLSIGAGLLRGLLDHFHGNAAVALAAYNGGRGAARGWLRRRAHLETDAFVETIPRDQPRRYTMRVIAVSEVYRRLHGVSGPRVTVPWRLPLALGPFLASPAPVEPVPETAP